MDDSLSRCWDARLCSGVRRYLVARPCLAVRPCLGAHRRLRDATCLLKGVTALRDG
jgi:hypothetical protein